MLTSNLYVFLVFFVTYIQFSHPLCTNIEALYNITARVHLTRSEKGFNYNGNLYNLDQHEVIDVTQGNVTDLCEGIVKKFPKLQVLSLINVNISKIQPNAFLDVPKLRVLSLSVNNLTEIENGCFNNIPRLEILYLSGNNIHTIGNTAFQNFHHLKKVHLDRNQLTRLEANIFSGSPNLHLLDLRFNLLTIVDKNNFPHLQPTFKGPITFLLESNQIDDVDPSTFEFNNPVKLHLQKNKLSTISNLFHGLRDYSTLNLDENLLSCLPDDVLDNIKTTNKNISIKQNPITCDCLKNIENSLGDGEELFGVGVLEYSSMFQCFGQISF